MRILIVAAAGLAAATLVGCGGDDGGGSAAPAISKTDFVAQANEICQAGAADLASALGTLDPNSSADELEQIFVETVIPNIRQQVTDIRALGFPAGDEATLDGAFDQVEQILTDYEANPATMLDDSTDEFADVNQQLTAYGLETCGQS